jgi:hypothetical protein
MPRLRQIRTGRQAIAFRGTLNTSAFAGWALFAADPHQRMPAHRFPGRTQSANALSKAVAVPDYRGNLCRSSYLLAGSSDSCHNCKKPRYR